MLVTPASVAALPVRGWKKTTRSKTGPVQLVLLAPDAALLEPDAPSVFTRRVPLAAEVWQERGWRFPDRLDRVYVNARARRDLRWSPRFDLNAIAARVAGGEPVQTPLSKVVGAKEYPAHHRQRPYLGAPRAHSPCQLGGIRL